MIARDSRGTPDNTPRLSAEVAGRLRCAIEARWQAVNGADSERATGALSAALDAAAVEARARSLHPEAMVLSIKALEGEVAVRCGILDHAERRALRAALVTACIRAYFRAP